MEDRLRRSAQKFFEPLHDLDLFHAHNKMNFYTWGEKRMLRFQKVRTFSNPPRRSHDVKAWTGFDFTGS